MGGRSSIQQNYNGTVYLPGSTLEAAPESFPRDGDLHIVFLSGNGIRFSAPVNDLWYRATIPTKPVDKPGSLPDLHAYRPDEAASPMACLQRFQFCDGSTSRCGPLASWADAQTGADELFGTNLEAEDTPLDSERASRFYWFLSLMTYSVPNLSSVLLQLGAASLASTRTLYAGLMGPLPNDQWQVDVMQWWATYLAGIQGGVVSTAAGPADSSLEHQRIEPYNKWIQDQICNNQVSYLSLRAVFERCQK